MKYYVPDHGETKEDAHEFDSGAGLIDVPGDIPCEWDAEDAAAYAFDHHDGWEWHWPIVMVLIGDGGERAFEVQMESTPTFTARQAGDFPEV